MSQGLHLITWRVGCLGRRVGFMLIWSAVVSSPDPASESAQVPLARSRLVDFVRWQLEARFLIGEGELWFPQLLLIAANDGRLLEMWRGLNRAALQGEIKPLPPTFLTTAHLLTTRGVHTPVWLSTESARWGNVFEGVSALPKSYRVFSSPDIQRLPTSKLGTFCFQVHRLGSCSTRMRSAWAKS